MKMSTVIALLVIGGVIFYVAGGESILGWGQPTNLPDTIEPPNATFIGSEQDNPYAQ